MVDGYAMMHRLPCDGYGHGLSLFPSPSTTYGLWPRCHHIISYSLIITRPPWHHITQQYHSHVNPTHDMTTCHHYYHHHTSHDIIIILSSVSIYMHILPPPPQSIGLSSITVTSMIRDDLSHSRTMLILNIIPLLPSMYVCHCTNQCSISFVCRFIYTFSTQLHFRPMSLAVSMHRMLVEIPDAPIMVMCMAWRHARERWLTCETIIYKVCLTRHHSCAADDGIEHWMGIDQLTVGWPINHIMIYLAGAGPAIPITPQPTRPPALPVVNDNSITYHTMRTSRHIEDITNIGNAYIPCPPLPKSSTSAWMTNARPITDVAPINDTNESVMLTSTLPSAPASTLPKSPTWRFSSLYYSYHCHH